MTVLNASKPKTWGDLGALADEAIVSYSRPASIGSTNFSAKVNAHFPPKVDPVRYLR